MRPRPWGNRDRPRRERSPSSVIACSGNPSAPRTAARSSVSMGDRACRMDTSHASPISPRSAIGSSSTISSGSARANGPRGTSLFTIERGVEEVEGVRRALGLGRIHLLGNSYGGMLALAYAIKYQRNLRGLVVASGLYSVPVANVELRRLVRTLPIPVQRTIDRLERREAFDDPAYARAAMAFYRRHICRLRTWPRELTRSLREVSVPVYRTMWGPSEFAVQGSLRYWDITDQLPAIKVPTLITGGKYDEIPPRIARTIHRGIRGSKLAIFPNSSHLPMWEERERYMHVVGEFLRRQDGR